MKRILLAITAVLMACVAQRWVVGDQPGTAVLLFGVAAILYLVAIPRDRELFPLGAAWPTRRRSLHWAGLILCAAAVVLTVMAATHFMGDAPEPGGWSLHLYSVLALIAGALLLDQALAPPRREGRPSRAWWPALGLTLLVVLAAALRLPGLENQPFGIWYDEAANALVARDILANPGYHPLYLGSTFHTAHHNYLAAAAFRFLGDSIGHARLVSALMGVAMVAAGYLAAAEIFHTEPSPDRKRSYVAPTMGLLMAGVLTVSAWSLNFSRIAVNYIATPLFILLAVGFLLHGLRTQRMASYFGAGLALGLGVNFYSSFRLFVPVLPLFLLALLVARREMLRSSWRGILLLGFAAIVVAAPLLTFAANNRETFLKRTRDTYLLREIAPDQRLQVLWENTVRHALMFNVRGDPNGRHNLPGRPMLDPYLAGLFALGVVVCLWRWRRPHSILLLLWLGFTLLGGILTLDFEAPQSLRSNGAIPAAYMIALLPIAEILRAWERSQAGKYYPRAAAVTAGLLLVPVAVWNLNAFFVVQRNDFAVWNAFSTAETITGRTLAGLDPATNEAYVISYFHGHPSISYMAPQWVDRYQRIEGGDPAPLNWVQGKDAWVFLDADSDALYARLQAIYPDGEFVEHHPPFSDAVSLRTVHLTPEVLASVQGLEANYYANDNWEGAPARTERTSTVDFEWQEQPALPFPFSAEYQGVLRAPDYGSYGLRLVTSGASTLWIDESPVISGKGDLSQTVTLARGNHAIRLRALGEPGALSLQWTPPGRSLKVIPAQELFAGPVTANGLLGRYFPNDAWSPPEQLAVVDPQMNIQYHIIPLDRPFTVEWTGKIAVPLAGEYQFEVEAIDEAQLVIDGDEVLKTEAASVASLGRATLSEGLHDIEIRYSALSPHSRINLWWTPPGGARSPVPSQLLFPPRGTYADVEIPSFAMLAPALQAGELPAPAAEAPTDQLAGETVTVLTGLNHPAGIAAGEGGRVYVADTGNDRLLVVGPDGTIERTVTGGTSPFGEPFDVATDAEGLVYVLDAEASNLAVFDGQGEFVRMMAPRPEAAGRSRGLGVGPDGRIWVANTPGQRIVALDDKAVIEGEFPVWEGEDAQVVDVAAAPDGTLYATALGVNKLIHFDASGHRLSTWEIPAANTVDGPHVAVDAAGSIYVTQPEESRVARYSPYGEQEGFWQLPTSPDRVKPVGIAVDATGRIWLTDTEGGRVVRIDPPGLEPAAEAAP